MLLKQGLTTMAVACLLAVTGTASAASLVVRSEGGKVQGFTKSVLGTDRLVEVFLGVPYAKPPVGDLRWKKAERVDSWSFIKDASVMPKSCVNTEGGSEDCLYVNIYRPEGTERGQRLPVVVYAHGGANSQGAAAEYDGARLANQNKLIVVTVQYRLGAFGFLNTAGMDSEAGNFGLSDLTAALRWVRRNINAFGGDVFKVTLMGQASGATNTCRILTDKAAKGLVHGAILQSDDCMHDVDSREQSTQRSNRFVEQAGCKGESDVLSCLRSLPTDALRNASAAVGRWNPVGNSVSAELIGRGEWNKVPVLMGANREAGRSLGASFIGRTDTEYTNWVKTLLGSAAQQALIRYPAYKYSNKYAIPYVAGDLITDSGLYGLGGCSNLSLARQFIKGESPAVYVYEFQDSKAPMTPRMSDYQNLASIDAELPYLWPDSARWQPLSSRFSAEQWNLSDAMRLYWSLFIRYQNPNTRYLPAWKRFTPNGTLLALRADQPIEAISAEEFESAHKCSFWSGVPPVVSQER